MLPGDKNNASLSLVESDSIQFYSRGRYSCLIAKAIRLCSKMVRSGCRGCPGGIPFEAPTCDTFMWFRGCLLASFLFIQTWTRIFNLMKPPEGWTFMGALRQCSFPRSRRSGRERYLRSNVCLDIFLFLQLLSGRTLKQTSDLATSHRYHTGSQRERIRIALLKSIRDLFLPT